MPEDAKELFIDVSEYEAPQPFQEVMQLLVGMNSGEYIRMLHRKKPLPLLELLQENGFSFNVKQDQLDFQNESLLDDAHKTSALWEIIIWNKLDSKVNNYCLKKFC
ncbi:MAG: DUF2249 domain-containing protein [Gammaproteobacteria bacterium]|nr:DUF2249 domain-containing protein [Gammaproteobacteria bacterium]